MRKATLFPGLALLTLAMQANLATAGGSQFTFTVVPFDFDPYRTHLVEAEWEDGIGCPNNATTAPFLPPNYDTVGHGMYEDPACRTADPRDKRNFGLLLVKTGPTNNDASAGAVIVGVKGTSIEELGYDLRKPGDGTGLDVPFGQSDPRGSHCGAGAPRFNIEIQEDPGNTYFLGCNSPPPDFNSSGIGWQRLRWGGPGGLPPVFAYKNGVVLTDITYMHLESLSIVFDEGQDASGGPDNFGLAVLDNIDVNGTMVGRGREKAEEKDRDECEGEDKDKRHFHSSSSSSRPESSNMSYEDPSAGTKVQMVDGARSVTYSGTCVTSVGDALLNGKPGYTVTFAACDLSAVPLTPQIGTYVVTVAGPTGVAYQKSGALTSGFVSIHPR